MKIQGLNYFMNGRLKDLQRFLLYHLPLTDNLSHFRLINIFYECYKDTLKAKNQEKISKIDIIHR
jgi:hypothetical protein